MGGCGTGCEARPESPILRRPTPRRHLSAPLKTVPPYVSFDYSTAAATAPIELCNVESGLQYLGIRGAESDGA